METTIGALVLTYNEEDRIKECLKSLSWVDEIVIIDSFSEDNTVSICTEYTDKIYQREFDNFSVQRNYGLQKIETDWVLILDADERITESLSSEIIEEIKSPNYKAYEIPRKNFFMGKWLKCCGLYPDYTVRLFKNNNINYENKVHEGINYDGERGQFENDLLHHTYRNLSHYSKKLNHYAELSAKDKFQAGIQTNIFYIVVRPLFDFIQMYIFQRGFLGGGPGLIYSIIHSYYTFLKYARLWEQRRNLDKC